MEAKKEMKDSAIKQEPAEAWGDEQSGWHQKPAIDVKPVIKSNDSDRSDRTRAIITDWNWD